jgi:hypothetical protein
MIMSASPIIVVVLNSDDIADDIFSSSLLASWAVDVEATRCYYDTWPPMGQIRPVATVIWHAWQQCRIVVVRVGRLVSNLLL